MTASILNMGSYFDDMMPLSANTVELLDATIVWATQLAQVSTGLGTQPDAQPDTQPDTQPSQEWEALLKALAIAGFEQWLGEGATPLAVTHAELAANLSEKTIHLTVGDYRLCLVAMGSLSDDQVEISLKNAAESLEDAIAHLYVIVEVQEEVNQVCILAGLRRDQLLQRINRERLQQAHSSEAPLIVPASYFDVEPEQILLYLNCLEPARETIEQTTFISAAAREGRTAIAESVVNVGSWLQERLDTVTEQLKWTLLPPLSSAMRPIRESVDTVLETLAEQGISLPEEARGVGGPISIGSCTFQIYAWVWPLEIGIESEWTLFLLLGPQTGEILPEGIQLQVSDRAEVLVQEVLDQASSEAYLYTQVQGDRQEQFKVSVILPDGMEITLPAFVFDTAAQP
ncbi:MAG: DUF1822 family protein [Phormidesmis sp.]